MSFTTHSFNIYGDAIHIDNMDSRFSDHCKITTPGAAGENDLHLSSCNVKIPDGAMQCNDLQNKAGTAMISFNEAGTEIDFQNKSIVNFQGGGGGGTTDTIASQNVNSSGALDAAGGGTLEQELDYLHSEKLDKPASTDAAGYVVVTSGSRNVNYQGFDVNEIISRDTRQRLARKFFKPDTTSTTVYMFPGTDTSVLPTGVAGSDVQRFIADTASTQTFTNKTLTSPEISTITNGGATLTLPTSTGTVALTSDIPAADVTQSGSHTFTGTNKFQGDVEIDEDSIYGKLEFLLSNGALPPQVCTTRLRSTQHLNTSATNFTISLPAIQAGQTTEELVGKDAQQTLTNKTLTSPEIATITNGSATLTLPSSTGTVALLSDISGGGIAESDNLTFTGSFAINNSTGFTCDTSSLGVAFRVEGPTAIGTGGWSGQCVFGGPDAMFIGGEYGQSTAGTRRCLIGAHNSALTAWAPIFINDGHDVTVCLNSGTFRVRTSVVSSDDRLKHNEEPVMNALDVVDQLAPLTYFKSGGSNEDGTPKFYPEEHDYEMENGKPVTDDYYTRETGFIAQDVQKIPQLSHLVTEGTDAEPYGLDYTGLFTYNVKAVQELYGLVKTLQQEVASLKQQIAAQ